MIEYPAELPYPDLSGYALEHAPNLMRTPMVSGRARQRQRYTSIPSFVTLSWGMPQKEFELFEAWFRWELKEGQEWFTGWAQTGGITTQTVMRFVGSEMCIRDRTKRITVWVVIPPVCAQPVNHSCPSFSSCLLYTSDAADE